MSKRYIEEPNKFTAQCCTLLMQRQSTAAELLTNEDDDTLQRKFSSRGLCKKRIDQMKRWTFLLLMIEWFPTWSRALFSQYEDEEEEKEEAEEKKHTFIYNWRSVVSRPMRVNRRLVTSLLPCPNKPICRCVLSFIGLILEFISFEFRYLLLQYLVRC